MVRDVRVHKKVLSDLSHYAGSALAGCAVLASTESPILGGDGNKEFLLALAHAKHLPVPHAHKESANQGELATQLGDDDTGLLADARARKPLRTAAARAAAYANRRRNKKQLVAS